MLPTLLLEQVFNFNTKTLVIELVVIISRSIHKIQFCTFCKDFKHSLSLRGIFYVCFDI